MSAGHGSDPPGTRTAEAWPDRYPASFHCRTLLPADDPPAEPSVPAHTQPTIHCQMPVLRPVDARSVGELPSLCDCSAIDGDRTPTQPRAPGPVRSWVTGSVRGLRAPAR